MNPRVKPVLDRFRVDYEEKGKTFRMECPACGHDDKFSMLQANGHTVCYRGSCNWGKKNFAYYISQIAKIPIEAAKTLVYGGDVLLAAKDRIDLSFMDDEKPLEALKEVPWPDRFSHISGLFPSDSRSYLENRGIPLELIHHYEIRWDSLQRRVVLPIFMNHTCYGWQGRAIDFVDDRDRMRNNLNFRRDTLVMFYDQIAQGGHVIICEGPFDAMKFHECGGNIATLGKVVTDKQIELLQAKKPSAYYLGLDDDAFEEMRVLRQKLRGTPIYQLSVPQTTVDRCKAIGKKADFGECTFAEANYAFTNAILYRNDQIYIKLL